MTFFDVVQFKASLLLPQKPFVQKDKHAQVKKMYIFNTEGVEVFWNLLCLDYEFTDEYIEQLWEELKEFQL